MGGGVVLLNSILNSIPIFFLSGGAGVDSKKKIVWVSWVNLCKLSSSKVPLGGVDSKKKIAWVSWFDPWVESVLLRI
jgi:hypothetical protein